MTPQSPAPLVLLTLGDPNGLGPELACRFLSSVRNLPARLLIIGPEQALARQARTLGIPRFWEVPPPGGVSAPDLGLPARGIFLYAPPGLDGFAPTPGRATVQGGLAAGLSLESACSLLAQGVGRALVTCPLNKAMLQEAGFAFAGHTEFLAARAGMVPEEICMHFWGPRLRVSLATTHPPLRGVPGLITKRLILRKLELTLELMRIMGRKGPVAVCGLNPHAGESGRMGDEEERILAPAVLEAASRGWQVAGPLAADTVFHRARSGEFSAVLAMYHDQGLGPFKLLHFYTGIQITLGLPYVRTSPDHGTGYDLVGRGTASPQSLANALRMAVRLAFAPFTSTARRSS